MERDWSIKTEIPTDPAEFIVWTFNSYDSAGSTSLQLGVHFENLNNGLTMTVYCPFWMLNKTGLTLSYRVSNYTIISYDNLNFELCYSIKKFYVVLLTYIAVLYHVLFFKLPPYVAPISNSFQDSEKNIFLLLVYMSLTEILVVLFLFFPAKNHSWHFIEIAKNRKN